jgi:hypothetical protein
LILGRKLVIPLTAAQPGTQLLRVALPEEILDVIVGGDDAVPLPHHARPTSTPATCAPLD